MRIEGHIEKIKSLRGTLSKLDDEEDHETILELCMLISSHYINAALHSTGRLRADKDLRHNLIPGKLKREEYLNEHSIEIGDLFQELEEMRPSQVYGTGRNGATARRARKILSNITDFCEEFIYV
jgi:hypothetical protein